MNEIAFELVERIAKMEAMKVPHAQIALALGIEEITVSTIIIAPKCQAVIQSVLAGQFDKAQTLNDGWDMIEAASANVVLETLQTNPDPDFALKALTAANKAQRRGVHGNAPIQGAAGVRAVLELNATFVEKLQQNFQVAPPLATGALQQKDTDFLSPGDVESLLRSVPQANANAIFSEMDALGMTPNGTSTDRREVIPAAMSEAAPEAAPAGASIAPPVAPFAPSMPPALAPQLALPVAASLPGPLAGRIPSELPTVEVANAVESQLQATGRNVEMPRLDAVPTARQSAIQPETAKPQRAPAPTPPSEITPDLMHMAKAVSCHNTKAKMASHPRKRAIFGTPDGKFDLQLSPT